MDRFEEELKALLRSAVDKLKRDELSDEVVHAEDHIITTNDIITDQKIFAEDIYDGEITEQTNDSIVVSFRNGQVFRISVSEEHISRN